MAKKAGSGVNRRSTDTGRFVTKAAVKRSPSTTVTEKKGGGSTRGANRSASTGKFVSPAAAKRNPKGTMRDS